MTQTELKNLFRSTLTAQRTIAQEYIALDAIVDFISQALTSGIPTWTALLTFQTDGTDDGTFALYPDTSANIRFWKTKVDNNINNAPPTNPLTTETTEWIEVSPSDGSAIKEWAAGVYGDGLIIVYHNHSTAGRGLYILTEATRPYDSSNIETELTAGDWAVIGGGGGTPGGADTEVQFNDGGAFGGDAGLTYNKTTNALTLGGALQESKGADIASATTTDIGAATGNYLDVTGTTTITGLGTIQAGTRRIVTFTGVLILTYNATSLILPTAANITTAAGDVAEFVSLGSGNWKCAVYTRANGNSLSGSVGSAALPPAKFDGMGAVILAGSKTYMRAKFSGTITGWSIIADGSSPTCELYIKKIATGTALPSASIVASDPPDLTTGNAIKSTSLTGWTTSIDADDILEIGITTATVMTRMEYTLYLS